jgi:SMC interacting uncharacterized protein involved in chromosome segregation
MAVYHPDYKYEKGKKYLDQLCSENTEDAENLKHYINKKEEHIDNLNKKLDEYHKFFEQMRKYCGAAPRTVTYD